MNSAKAYIHSNNAALAIKTFKCGFCTHKAHIHTLLTHIAHKDESILPLARHPSPPGEKAINESTEKHVLFMGTGVNKNKLFRPKRPVCDPTIYPTCAAHTNVVRPRE